MLYVDTGGFDPHPGGKSNPPPPSGAAGAGCKPQLYGEKLLVSVTQKRKSLVSQLENFFQPGSAGATHFNHSTQHFLSHGVRML